MMKEFKEFAMRGNVVDLAVGLVIGTSFGKIVTSLVEDIINPIIGMVANTKTFTDQAFDLQIPNTAIKVSLRWGNFINTVVQFTLVAFCLFLVVKAMNAMKRSHADAPPPPAPPTKDQELLTEIRDLLKTRGA